jgi:Domain of unknown function (DUF6458)
MGMGGAVVLFAVGAILKFATSAHVSGIDLQQIGVIIMLVSALWFAIMVAIYFSRRRSTVLREERVTGDPIYQGRQRRVYQERSDYDSSDPAYRAGQRRVYEERSDYDEPI